MHITTRNTEGAIQKKKTNKRDKSSRSTYCTQPLDTDQRDWHRVCRPHTPRATHTQRLRRNIAPQYTTCPPHTASASATGVCVR
jgi:hypothetical protein